MSTPIKETSWLADLINTFNELGGVASYQDIYPVTKRIRLARGGNWTPKSDATIRRSVEDNSSDSDNFRGREVFYSVKGIGKGTWGLLPAFLQDNQSERGKPVQPSVYQQGLEGIAFESIYLRKSRDPRLVESRKLLDNFTCQVCGFRMQVAEDKFIIDVHHLNPVSDASGPIITSIENLICLCPNCHRIAHSGQSAPLSLKKIAAVLNA